MMLKWDPRLFQPEVDVIERHGHVEAGPSSFPTRRMPGGRLRNYHAVWGDLDLRNVSAESEERVQPSADIS